MYRIRSQIPIITRKRDRDVIIQSRHKGHAPFLIDAIGRERPQRGFTAHVVERMSCPGIPRIQEDLYDNGKFMRTASRIEWRLGS